MIPAISCLARSWCPGSLASAWFLNIDPYLLTCELQWTCHPVPTQLGHGESWASPWSLLTRLAQPSQGKWLP